MRYRLAILRLILCGLSGMVCGADSTYFGTGGADFKGFDPINAGDTTSGDYCARVYEGLLEYAYLERPYKAIPRLAEAMPAVSADGLTYTFKIKKGVHFMDDPCFPDGKGRELVAEDFVYSFKRLLNIGQETQGDWIFANHVLGAADWQAFCLKAKGMVDYAKPMPGFTAPDHYTLQIKLHRPYPQLIWVLTMVYSFVVPYEAVTYYNGEKGREPFINHPVGTGPYRLKQWKRNYRIEFERNPQFSGQTYPDHGEPGDKAAGLLEDAGKPLPILDHLVDYDIRETYTEWQMFLGGQLASSGLSKDNFEKVVSPKLDLTEELTKMGIRLVKSPELMTRYMGFNMRDPVVGQSPDPVVNEKHKKLRQAISCAIDRNKMIQVLINGRGVEANSVIPLQVPGHTEEPFAYAYNLDKASQLLAEAGYPAGKDSNGRELILTLDAGNAGSTDGRQSDDFLVSQFRKIGIHLNVTEMSWTEFLRRNRESEQQMFQLGWVIDYPDGQNFLQLFYGPNESPGINSTNYRNSEFDQLYERILSMPDTAERTALYEKMARMVQEDCPWVLEYYPLSYGLFQSWFQNYKFHPLAYGNIKYHKVLPH